MSNVKKAPSETAKTKKLLLLRGDPLIGVLNPDYYTIVEDGSFEAINVYGKQDGSEEDGENESEEPPFVNDLKAPSLSDIKFVSATMVTDKNKNQFVDFVFNINNSVGESVVGVEAYGQ